MINLFINTERIPILKDSHIRTLKKKGYTIGKSEMDIDTGENIIKIYHFGEIKKVIVFDIDKRKN